MTVDQIYQLVLFILDKEMIGASFTDDQFNVVLPDCQWVVINNEIKKVFLGELTPVANEIIAASPLRTLKTTSTTTAIPADYIRFTSLRADYGQGWLPMEPVGDAEAIRRASNVYYLANLHPFCSIAKQLIAPVPNNPTAVELNYLQKPAVPFRDYCQDAATLDSIFMPIGSKITAVDNQGVLTNVLYDSGGNVLANNVLPNNAAAVFPYASKTVELVLPEEVHEAILLAVLSKCSVNLEADQVTQYAEAKAKEQ